MAPPPLFFVFKIVLAILGPFSFHISLGINLSVYKTFFLKILTGTEFYLDHRSILEELKTS